MASAVSLALPVAAQRGSGSSSAEVWPMLSKKYDKNQDGKITAEEYPRGDRGFTGLDRNRDGTISKEDFERAGRNRGRGGSRGNRGGGRGSFNMGRSVAGRIAPTADADKDGKVTTTEWKAAVAKLDADKNGRIEGDEMTSVVRMRGGRGSERMLEMITGSLDKNSDGKVQVDEIGALFAELDRNKDKVLSGEEIPRQRGSRGGRGPRGGGGPARSDGAPQVGETAPDFDLPLVSDSKRTVKLSSFRGQRPVALIFGSYT